MSKWPYPQLRQLTRRISDGTHGTYERTDDGQPLLSAKNVNRGSVHWNDSDSMVSLADYERIRSERGFEPGDVLLTIVGTIGRSAILKPGDPLAFQRSVASLKPGPQLDSRFLLYVTASQPFQNELVARASTSAQSGIYLQDLAQLRIPLPPLAEQRAIADYLDVETARIDALIAKKQQLIHLLEERRVALIDLSTASVDQAWVPLRRLASHITSGPRGWAQFVADTGRPFLRITNIDRKSIQLDMSDTLLVDPPESAESDRTRTQRGDVLVSITADIGSVGVVDALRDGSAISQHVALVRPSVCTSEWLAYAIKATASQVQLDSGQYGGTKTQLSLEDIASLRIPLPSLDVQVDRMSKLERQLTNLEATGSGLANQVGLLKERRQALITAAVTGEFTVPGVR